MHALEIKAAEMFEQRLDGQEADGCGRGPEMLNTWQAVATILNADAPPNVRQISGKPEVGPKQVAQSLRALGENLVRVPVRQLHDAYHAKNVFVRHVLVKEVAHAVDEHHSRFGPAQGFRK